MLSESFQIEAFAIDKDTGWIPFDEANAEWKSVNVTLRVFGIVPQLNLFGAVERKRNILGKQIIFWETGILFSTLRV